MCNNIFYKYHMNRNIVSLSLTSSNYQFLEEYAAKIKDNKSAFVNTLLENYRKSLLWKEMREGKENQTNNDREYAELGMSSYLKIIENYESN